MTSSSARNMEQMVDKGKSAMLIDSKDNWEVVNTKKKPIKPNPVDLSTTPRSIPLSVRSAPLSAGKSLRSTPITKPPSKVVAGYYQTNSLIGPLGRLIMPKAGLKSAASANEMALLEKAESGSRLTSKEWSSVIQAGPNSAAAGKIYSATAASSNSSATKPPSKVKADAVKITASTKTAQKLKWADVKKTLIAKVGPKVVPKVIPNSGAKLQEVSAVEKVDPPIIAAKGITLFDMKKMFQKASPDTATSNASNNISTKIKTKSLMTSKISFQHYSGIDEELKTRRFVAKKIKKKTLSTTKKRIVMERLKNHKKKQAMVTKEESTETANATSEINTETMENSKDSFLPADMASTEQFDMHTASSSHQLFENDLKPINTIKIDDANKTKTEVLNYPGVNPYSEPNPTSSSNSEDIIENECKDQTECKQENNKNNRNDGSNETVRYELKLEHTIFEEDIGDEDEIEEVLNDILSLCQEFGDVSSVRLEKQSDPNPKSNPNPNPYTNYKHDISNDSLDNDDNYNDDKSKVRQIKSNNIATKENTGCKNLPWLMIEYESYLEASQSIDALSGLCVGGLEIIASLYNYSAYMLEDYDDSHCLYSSEKVSHSDKAVIVVKNYVSSEDLEECEGDTEELGAIKRDVLSLIKANKASGDLGGNDKLEGRNVRDDSGGFGGCGSSGGRSFSGSDGEGVVEKANTLIRVTIVKGDEDGMTIQDNINKRIVACVSYPIHSEAVNAMLSLDGTTLGGNIIKASIQTLKNSMINTLNSDSNSSPNSDPNSNLNSHHNSHHNSDPNSNSNSDPNLRPSPSHIIATRIIEITQKKTISNPNPNPNTTDGPLNLIEKNICIPNPSPNKTYSVSNTTNPNSNSTTNNVDNTIQIIKKTKKERIEKAKQESKYVEALSMPKLDKNVLPRLLIKVASEELDLVVKDLLQAIALFQEKMKEKDPIKAVAKKRFVLGMKQATNGVKAGRVKLLLLAPDTEASETIDDKLDTLLDEAQSREIPIIYCLNRRKLGKAIKSSMKQAVVAVYDPDGAYEFFKKIIFFIDQPIEVTDKIIEAEKSRREVEKIEKDIAAVEGKGDVIQMKGGGSEKKLPKKVVKKVEKKEENKEEKKEDSNTDKEEGNMNREEENSSNLGEVGMKKIVKKLKKKKVNDIQNVEEDGKIGEKGKKVEEIRNPFPPSLGEGMACIL